MRCLSVCVCGGVWVYSLCIFWAETLRKTYTSHIRKTVRFHKRADQHLIGASSLSVDETFGSEKEEFSYQSQVKKNSFGKCCKGCMRWSNRILKV